MNPFKVAGKDVDQLIRQHLHASSALRVYETLRRSRSPKHVGRKQAEKNVLVIGDYKYFLSFSEETFRFYMFIELAKMFDPDRRVRSLPNLIKYLQHHLPSLSSDNFFKFRESEGETTPDHMRPFFKPLSKRDIAIILRSIKAAQPIIKKLMRYRHQALAHTASDYQHVNITGTEVHRLFRVLEKSLDRVAKGINWSSMLRDSYLRDTENDTERVIADLRKFRELKRASTD